MRARNKDRLDKLRDDANDLYVEKVMQRKEVSRLRGQLEEAEGDLAAIIRDFNRAKRELEVFKRKLAKKHRKNGV